jgi:hypothetical protein
MTNVMHKLFILFNHILLPYMAEIGESAWVLTPFSRGLNHCRNYTPASEDGLKESPKHVRQK